MRNSVKSDVGNIKHSNWAGGNKIFLQIELKEFFPIHYTAVNIRSFTLRILNYMIH
jgi:hypothetical protein